MKKKYYCPICGFEFKYPFTLGVICSYCWNENEYNDIGFIKDTIDWSKYESYVLMASELHMKNKSIPKEIRNFLDDTSLPQEEIWGKSRKTWIENNFKNKTSLNLSINKIRKQLLNIKLNDIT